LAIEDLEILLYFLNPRHSRRHRRHHQILQADQSLDLDKFHRRHLQWQLCGLVEIQLDLIQKNYFLLAFLAY
jgi:hypothetical protein